jgi:hypothetical protein
VNDCDAPIRIFRWSQSGGHEILEPATDVVASPQVVTLPPAKNYTARIVHVAKRPVVGEEAYCIFVDQRISGWRQEETSTSRRTGGVSAVAWRQISGSNSRNASSEYTERLPNRQAHFMCHSGGIKRIVSSGDLALGAWLDRSRRRLKTLYISRH